MAKSKYIKRGVKRQHQIINGILPLLEQTAKIEGVKKVIPTIISYSPTRNIRQPELRFQRETVSGFKLSAHSKGGIQDIFVIVEKSKKREVENALKKHVKSRYATIIDDYG